MKGDNPLKRHDATIGKRVDKESTGTQPIDPPTPTPAPEHDAPPTAHVEPVAAVPVVEPILGTPAPDTVPLGCCGTPEA